MKVGNLVIAILIMTTIVCIGVLFIPVSNNNANVQIAQSQAQIAVQQTKDYSAQLRAEETARTTSYTMLILAVIVGFACIMALGGAIIFGTTWADNKQMARNQTYLLQQQALYRESLLLTQRVHRSDIFIPSGREVQVIEQERKR